MRGCAFDGAPGVPYPRADLLADADRLPGDHGRRRVDPGRSALDFVGNARAVEVEYETQTEDLGYRGDGAGRSFSLWRGDRVVDAVPALLGAGAATLELRPPLESDASEGRGLVPARGDEAGRPPPQRHRTGTIRACAASTALALLWRFDCRRLVRFRARALVARDSRSAARARCRQSRLCGCRARRDRECGAAGKARRRCHLGYPRYELLDADAFQCGELSRISAELPRCV